MPLFYQRTGHQLQINGSCCKVSLELSFVIKKERRHFQLSNAMFCLDYFLYGMNDFSPFGNRQIKRLHKKPSNAFILNNGYRFEEAVITNRIFLYHSTDTFSQCHCLVGYLVSVKQKIRRQSSPFYKICHTNGTKRQLINLIKVGRCPYL